MRLTSSRAYSRPAPLPKMPTGLVELMNGLTKDVLKHNPTNVYEFCANHMEKLLEIRDGPSSKKYLTLEQKIEKAQEKMRQKAKERREKFDKEMKLLYNHQTTEQDKENVLLDQGSFSSSVKALVHHEIDLQSASEVEISHTQENLTEVMHDSKLDEPKEIQMETVKDQEAENESADMIHDKQNENDEIEMKYDKKLDDVPVFEKVEIEVINEPLNGTELKEVVGLNVVDSSLQTISEISEENLVNDNAAILPKITIGDGHQMRELQNISGESFTETPSDAKDEVMKPTDVNTIPDGKAFENSNNGFERNSAPTNVANNVNQNSENKNIVLSTDNDKQNGLNDVSELTTALTHTIVETTLNLDVHEVSNSEKSHVASDDHNIASLKLEVPVTNSPGDSEKLSKVDATNKTTQKEGIEDSQIVVIASEDLLEKKQELTEIKTHIEEKSNDDHGNITEIDNIEKDAITTEPTVKSSEENINSDFENCQGNTEPSYPKLDSKENTNEDSVSMVETSLSKTDDDSAQNNSNMDLETAAVTIQKVFRSFMCKSRNSTFEDTINDENNSVDKDNDKKEEYYATANLNKERRPLGITRMESVLQTVNEEKSLSLSTDDSSTLSSAATTIQAHVRGFLLRNRLNSSKTFSMNSLVNSHEVLETDPEQHKNKTILNIHIVPEEGTFLSRDESLITSMDLSLDGSPPSSVNLHPMSCDISERRKMLKREDAVQSVTPPSNNSGKLSEDSVKEVLINENGILERELTDDKTLELDDQCKELENETSDAISSASTVTPTTIITISKSEDPIRSPRENTEESLRRNVRSFTKLSSDESDVITPFVPSPRSSEAGALVHSGEFHDVVLPTKVSRNDTPVVREFKNVLVYFLLWNSS